MRRLLNNFINEVYPKMEQVLTNPNTQLLLVMFLIGGVHFLCIGDILDAYNEGHWGKVFKQMLIECILIFLTWQGFVLPTLLQRSPAPGQLFSRDKTAIVTGDAASLRKAD